jgi:hypothetical protein
VAVGLDDARQEFFLRVIAGGLLNRAFLVGEEFVEEEGVLPAEVGAVIHCCITPRFSRQDCAGVTNESMKDVLQGREIIIEFMSVGSLVKVSAIDSQSLTEISIQGPANAGKETLKYNAIKRLEYVLKKKGLL